MYADYCRTVVLNHKAINRKMICNIKYVNYNNEQLYRIIIIQNTAYWNNQLKHNNKLITETWQQKLVTIVAASSDSGVTTMTMNISHPTLCQTQIVDSLPQAVNIWLLYGTLMIVYKGM